MAELRHRFSGPAIPVNTFLVWSIVVNSAKLCPQCGRAVIKTNVATCPIDQEKLLTRNDIESLRDPNDLLVGMTLKDRYAVIRPLDEGGFGRVYLGVHLNMSSPVAIKVLQREYEYDPGTITLFIEEGRSATLARHPHVVAVHDLDHLPDGRWFLVSEFLTGESLARKISRNGFIPADEAVHIAMAVCSGLAAVHKIGIVHRDIKPSNIFLEEASGDSAPEGIVKIIDFGIATRPGTGQALGTPAYMAPEQFVPGKVSFASDIFAVGATLYEMLAGALPYGEDGEVVDHSDALQHELLLRLTTTPLLPRERGTAQPISRELESVVMKSINPNPRKRHQGATEMLRELENVPEVDNLKRGVVDITRFVDDGYWGEIPGCTSVQVDMTVDRSRRWYPVPNSNVWIEIFRDGQIGIPEEYQLRRQDSALRWQGDRISFDGKTISLILTRKHKLGQRIAFVTGRQEQDSGWVVFDLRSPDLGALGQYQVRANRGHKYICAIAPDSKRAIIKLAVT